MKVSSSTSLSLIHLLNINVYSQQVKTNQAKASNPRMTITTT
jgi:hypothetical protein